MNFVSKMPIAQNASLTFEEQDLVQSYYVTVYLLFIFSCLIAEDESFMTSCLMLE